MDSKVEEQLSARIDHLECELTVHQDLVETLSEQLFLQQKDINELNRTVDKLEGLIRSLVASEDGLPVTDSRAEPPPPHY